MTEKTSAVAQAKAELAVAQAKLEVAEAEAKLFLAKSKEGSPEAKERYTEESKAKLGAEEKLRQQKAQEEKSEKEKIEEWKREERAKLTSVERFYRY